VAVAAVVSLTRAESRPAVLRAWVVVVVALGATALLSSRTVSPSPGDPAQPLWLGFPLVLAQAAGITAAALAGAGVRRRGPASSSGWWQPLAVLLVALAVSAPVATLVWWVRSGSDGPLGRRPPSDIPAYLSDAAAQDPADGTLVVRGSRTRGYSYLLVRQAGLRLGDDSVAPSPLEESALTSYVGDLVASPRPTAVAALSRRGVGYVYAPAPADVALVGVLDSTAGLAPGSAGRRGDRAWRLEATPSDADLPVAPDRARPWLLAGQGIALVVALVLAAPSRRARR
jgi:hypothetical protein